MEKQGNIPMLVAGIVGSIKLLADTLGYQIITDEQVNANIYLQLKKKST
ncbi:hypothetical protein JNUCC42_00985 [Brevibacterium sp. JNUCC-42]|nr:hypothetical protein JNUCC42_00985 [Brevibacterium sp. JNUCC-42]